MDELKVEYTVKEIVQLIGAKIDKLDEKFDAYNELSNKRFEALERAQEGLTKVEEFKSQIDQNASRTKLGLYGVAATGIAAAVDLLMRVFHK